MLTEIFEPVTHKAWFVKGIGIVQITERGLTKFYVNGKEVDYCNVAEEKGKTVVTIIFKKMSCGK